MRLFLLSLSDNSLSLSTSNRFLYINLVSFNFTEFISFSWIFWWILLNFLYRVSCHLQIMTVLSLPFQFGYFYFIIIFFLFWLLQLGLPILCWIEVVILGILVLFLSLAGRLSAFQHWVLCWLWICHKWLLLCLRYVLSVPTLVRVFIMNWCWIFSKIFLHLLRWSWDFYTSFY